MKLEFHVNQMGISPLKELLASQEGMWSMELVYWELLSNW